MTLNSCFVMIILEQMLTIPSVRQYQMSVADVC